MRNQVGRTAGTGHALCLLASVMAFTSITVSGQVNSWISPESGSWDQPGNWSLGVLPDSSQSVRLTNSNWKAVAINPSTPVNFPDSMTVNSLTITSPADTENVLLLNYFGTDVPLTVLNGVLLSENSQLVNFSSGLVVQGGTFTIANSQMSQDGGSVQTMNAPMNFINGEYDLTNGVFNGGQVVLGDYYYQGRFNQYGGAVLITNLIISIGTVSGTAGTGTYALYGGYLSLPGGLAVTSINDSYSIYFQAGGTNQTTQVLVKPGLYGRTPVFTLNGGVLADSGVNIFADAFGTATIEQNGGTHVISNLLAIAGEANGFVLHPATYSLNDGALSARLIDLNGGQGDAVFVQSNGFASAETFYAYSAGNSSSNDTIVTLAGGTLSCSNYTTADGGGTLNQSGGALVVSSLLDFGGSRDTGGGNIIYARYTFTGGTLTASNVNISGDWVIGDGMNRISNPGTFSLSHNLIISNAVEQLGRFILVSNATVDLAGSPSQLSFANSSSQAWAGGATLVVLDWDGKTADQLKFGTDQSGLTPVQVSQIRFRIGSDSYSAKILNTGEVVPDQLIPPSIAFSRQGNNLLLTWPSGWFLQSATNVVGPYSDVSGAVSPYTVDTTAGPQGFFRLRQ